MQRPAETHLPALAGEIVSERGLDVRARPADPQLHLAGVYLPVTSRSRVAGEVGVHGELDGTRAARREVDLRGRDQLLDRAGHLGDRVMQVHLDDLGRRDGGVVAERRGELAAAVGRSLWRRAGADADPWWTGRPGSGSSCGS